VLPREVRVVVAREEGDRVPAEAEEIEHLAAQVCGARGRAFGRVSSVSPLKTKEVAPSRSGPELRERAHAAGRSA
jgi:hypothetical protein